MDERPFRAALARRERWLDRYCSRGASKETAHGASRGFVGAPEQAAEQGKKITVPIWFGAGFPGIPIKLWAPEISLTLIESNHKKATFLREVARALTLTDVDIQNARAESLLAARPSTWLLYAPSSASKRTPNRSGPRSAPRPPCATDRHRPASRR